MALAKHQLTYAYEETLIKEGFQAIAGIDEVGRGPLAGPVTAAAVIIKKPELFLELNDSKKLTAKKRQLFYGLINTHCYVGVGHADVHEIDEINILQATFLAMHRAAQALPIKPDYTLIDGNRMPKNWVYQGRSEIGGDGRVMSIAAASIIAKVTRDKIMQTLAADFPQYGWETNVGYGAKKHMEALVSHGATPHHRRSFAPVANVCT